MTKAPGSTRGIARAMVAATAVVLTMGAAVLPATAQSSITVRPPPSTPSWATPGSPDQDSGVPPTFQQYPFWNRILGPGGLIFPGYTSPVTSDRSYQRLALLTGGGAGRVVFAAGMADTLCQPADAPNIVVLSAPAGVKLSTDYGQFIATGNDAGSSFCRGRTVRGTRLVLAGRAPRAGGAVTLRVVWPRVGRNGGTSYTHTVALP